MYKLVFYHLTGANKGNRKGEIFFPDFETALAALRAVYEPELYSYNPTFWKKNGNDWERLTGY